MFSIGDKVVYPVHGAGIIESIENRDFLGTQRSYYVLNIPTSSMKVMVPCDNVSDVGIRNIISLRESERVLRILGGTSEVEEASTATVLDDKWNRRYRIHMDKIKGGNIYELAEIVRVLSIRNEEKPLSGGEKKLLDQAKAILISELVLVYDGTTESVLAKVDSEIGIKAKEEAPNAKVEAKTKA